MDVSSNGTHVDGALVHGDSVELEQGSVLKLGDTHRVVLLVRPRGAS
jgi:pSer/pThr/pTyr-binding forkhead associated (FHA) protein